MSPSSLQVAAASNSESPGSPSSVCHNAIIIQTYQIPSNSTYPVTLYYEGNGSLTEDSHAAGMSAHLVILHSLPGPIATVEQQCADPQYGYNTYNSANYYGTQDTEWADQTFLQANIMIGMGFTDNNGVWFHIGIGNNVNNGNVNSGCANPPVVWGEYKYGTPYTELPLQCASYGSGYNLNVVADNGGTWWWFVNGSPIVGFYYGTGSNRYINSGGTVDMIEASVTPYNQFAHHSATIFTNALQYASSPISSSTLSLGSTTWNNPSTMNPYNNGWSTTYWSESISSSAPWSISYIWS